MATSLVTCGLHVCGLLVRCPARNRITPIFITVYSVYRYSPNVSVYLHHARVRPCKPHPSSARDMCKIMGAAARLRVSYLALIYTIIAPIRLAFG